MENTSGRCRRRGLNAWRLRADQFVQWLFRLRAQGCCHRRPATPLSLCADPLRRDRVVSAHRRAGDAGQRSVLRPARGKVDARRVRRVRISPLRAGARAADAAAVGARHRGRAASAIWWRATMRRPWREHAQGLFGAAEAANSSMRRLASRPLTAGSWAARHRSGGRGAAMGRGKGAVRGGKPGRGAAPRGAVGQATDGLTDPGPMICACFGVGLNVIRAAYCQRCGGQHRRIARRRARTNCGSCWN